MVKIPSKITASYLENAAIYYLQRFASSSVNLRRVLLRKIQRSAAHWGDEVEALLPLLDPVIAKMSELGYLNDAAYAGQKLRALHRQGKGERVIRAALAAKGILAAQTDQAWQDFSQDEPDADRSAAWSLARKRRLGPFRPAEIRAEYRAKDLAAMGRAGFGYATAAAIIDAEETEIP